MADIEGWIYWFYVQELLEEADVDTQDMWEEVKSFIIKIFFIVVFATNQNVSKFA